ncbi:MAG: hypothetical protein QXK37_01000 [Candidatus Woesearchaeota archaeon]
MKIPKIKKKLISFLSDETGRISKQSIMSIGTVVGIGAITSALSTKTNAGNVTISVSSGNVVVASHTHHVSHGSHTSY